MFSLLVFGWALSFGYIPDQQEGVYESVVCVDADNGATYTSLKIDATLDRLYAYTSIDTYQFYNKGTISFIPYRADYKIGMQFYATDMLALSVEHECDHPVDSWKGNLAFPYYSSATKIGVTIGSNLRCKR